MWQFSKQTNVGDHIYWDNDSLCKQTGETRNLLWNTHDPTQVPKVAVKANWYNFEVQTTILDVAVIKEKIANDQETKQII